MASERPSDYELRKARLWADAVATQTPVSVPVLAARALAWALDRNAELEREVKVLREYYEAEVAFNIGLGIRDGADERIARTDRAWKAVEAHDGKPAKAVEAFDAERERAKDSG